MAEAREIAHLFERFLGLPWAGQGVSLGGMRHGITGGSFRSKRVIQILSVFNCKFFRLNTR